MSGFFDLEQLVGPVLYFVYFKGVVIFLDNKFQLFLDDFIVTLPYSIVQLSLIHYSWASYQRQPYSNAARGPYFFLELLVSAELMVCHPQCLNM